MSDSKSTGIDAHKALGILVSLIAIMTWLTDKPQKVEVNGPVKLEFMPGVDFGLSHPQSVTALKPVLPVETVRSELVGIGPVCVGNPSNHATFFFEVRNNTNENLSIEYAEFNPGYLYYIEAYSARASSCLDDGAHELLSTVTIDVKKSRVGEPIKIPCDRLKVPPHESRRMNVCFRFTSVDPKRANSLYCVGNLVIKMGSSTLHEVVQIAGPKPGRLGQ